MSKLSGSISHGNTHSYQCLLFLVSISPHRSAIALSETHKFVSFLANFSTSVRFYCSDKTQKQASILLVDEEF